MRKAMNPMHEPLMEMAFDRKKVIKTIEGFEPQINAHLIKVLGVKRPNTYIDHCKVEIENWLFGIAILRVKGGGTLKQKEYFKLLYDGPFVGSPIVSFTLTLLARSGYKIGPQAAANPQPIEATIKDFHRTFSAWVASNPDAKDPHLINSEITKLLSPL